MSAPLETVDRPSLPDEAEDFASYRAMSTLAVASLVAGVVSLLALVDWVFGVIPALGIVMGWRARRQIRNNPHELTGMPLANAGLVLSLLFLVSGWTLLGTIYITEVPDGYQRISYADLQPVAEGALASDNPALTGLEQGLSKTIVPPSAHALDGKRVFIKGYMFPGLAQGEGISSFVMVRDNGACCFGGNSPRLTDMILVTLEGDLRANYTTRLRKLAGTFKVETKQFTDPAEQEEMGNGKVSGVLYQLQADYLR